MFASRGFDAVKVSEIADRVNVSMNTLYNYFPTKESMVLDDAEELEPQGIRVNGFIAGRCGTFDGFARAATFILSPAASYLTDGGTLSAWGGYWFVTAGMLLLLLAGAGLALGILAGRPWRGPAMPVLIGFAFLMTITVVIALFIARPGGNAATAVAFGGYVALAAIGTIKGGAIVKATGARKRMSRGPATV
jgi:AcrR family transcriptional regulator